MPITPESREKIEKVKRLLNEIVFIEEEIERVLGETKDLEENEPVDMEIENKHPLKYTHGQKKNKGRKPSGKRKCKKCGKPGHRADGCHENEFGGGLMEIELMQGQWESIKESVRHDMSSKDIAIAMDIPIGEVNLVISSYDYDDYLSKR